MKSETNPAGSYVLTNNQQKTGKTLNRRAVLKNAIRASVETLERRQLLAVNTLWVNDNWQVTNDVLPNGLSAGDTVANTGLGDDGQVTEANLGSSLTFGTNAFNSIDSAVGQANSGDTIRVLAGVYTAASTINKSNIQVLGGTPSTLGDFSGIDKSTIDGRDSSRDPATSVREALIINGGSITVTASGVTVAGFTFRDDSFGAPLSIAASGSVIENNVFTGNIYGLDISGNNANVRTNYFVQNNAAGTNRSQGINVNGGATGVDIHDNTILTHNNVGATRAAGIVVQGTNTSATINNNFIAKSTVGVRIGSGASAIVTNNNFEGGANPDNSTDLLLEAGAGTPGSITGNTLAAPEFIRNLSSQAVTALSDSNVYQQPSPGVLVETDNYAIEGRVFHKLDSAASGLVTWVDGTIFVTDTTSPTATNNDYTRIANALDGAGDGYTINLKGSFDWTETNAAASWVKGNDAVSGNGDDYQAMVPAGLDNVTLTAPGALGDTTILGPGDLVGSAGGFLTFRGGPNVGWNISNLTIQNFEIGIGMFFGSPGSNTFDGTQITGNHIVVATDLNPAVSGLDDIYPIPPGTDVNVGIHYSFGDNQSISNNTIDMAGTGISDYGNGDYAASIGVLSNTNGSAYSNLSITGNTINVTGTQSSGSAEVIRGIWENGHAHGKTIHVSNNQFLNLSGGNNPALNLQRAFTVTSHSTGSGTVTYSGNTVVGANLGWQWLSGEDFSGNLPVEIVNNTLTNVGKGLLIQSNGSAHLVNNTLDNTAIAPGNSIGVQVVPGSSATLDDGVGVVPANSNEIKGFDIGVKVSGTASIADNVGSIYGNNVGIDVDGAAATATISGNHIYDNNIGVRMQNGAAAAITSNDFEGGASDDNLTDVQLLSATSSVTGGTLTGNNFAGSTFFIDNQSNNDITAIATTAVPAGTNTYNGAADNFRIEDKIHHAVDTDLAVTNGLVTWNANDVYITTPILGSTDSSIQRGVDVATAGDTVNVEAGMYVENVNVNKGVTVLGSGSSVAGTVVDPVTGNAITISANGASIIDLRITGASNGLYFDSAVANTTLSNVVADTNASYGIEIHNSAVVTGLLMTNVSVTNNAVGFRVATQGKVDGLVWNGGSASSNSYGIYNEADSSINNNQTGFTDVQISNLTITGNTGKGIYLEKLDDAVLDLLTVSNNGTIPSFPGGVDLNLKYGTYGGVSISNSTLTNNGTGAADGAGLAIKGRNDGSYSGNPASLTNVDLVNVDVTGSPIDISIGNNVNDISFTGVNLHGTGLGVLFYDMPAQALAVGNSTFAGTLSGYIANTTTSGVDATNATFGGVLASTADTVQQYAIIDKILDGVDVAGPGLVRTKVANVYVTTNSFYAPLGTTSALVQRAVNVASSGDTLHINTGTYTGQVDISSKDMTVLGEGEGSTVLKSPAALTLKFTATYDYKPVVYVSGGAVSISDLTVDGDAQGDANNRMVGIAYRNASGTIADTTVIGVRNNPLSGVQAGDAIKVLNTDLAPRVVNITNTTLSDYQKNGITFGGTGLSGTIQGNSATGAGITTLIAQNGIQVSDGASAVISTNTVTGHAYSGAGGGPDWINQTQSTGILLYDAGAGTTATSNIIKGNDIGIGVVGSDATISGNTLGSGVLAEQNRYYGILVEDGTLTLSGNSITGGNVGIAAYSTGASVSRIDVSGGSVSNSGTGVLVYDDAGAGTSKATIDNVNLNGAGTLGIGVDVNGGAAKIQDSQIIGRNIGIRVQNDAKVDAGSDSGDSNPSGLGTSTGNNDLSLYAGGGSGSYAIEDLNNVAGANRDVYARNNYFGNVVTVSVIEGKLYDDTDNGAKTKVLFSPPLNSPPLASTSVYVNDDWAGVPIGTDPDGAGPAGLFGVSAFSVIQDGVNAVQAGGAVHIYNGTYTENVVVPQSMHIDGLGVDSQAFTDTAVLLIPPANNTNTLTINASDVEVDGLTIDNNGLAKARYGILATSTLALTGINIHDNVVNDVLRRGIQLDSDLSAVGTITDNEITNVSGSDNGGESGIFVWAGEGVTVTGNTVSGAVSGITLQQGRGVTVDGNTVSGASIGIDVENSGGGGLSAADDIRNNTVSGGAGADSIGIFVFNTNVDDVIHNNTISGVDSGVTVSNVGTAGAEVTLTKNQISASDSGVLVDTEDYSYGGFDVTVNLGDGTAPNANVISGATDGVAVNSLYGRTASAILDTNTITASGTGVNVGAGSIATVTNTNFDGATDNGTDLSINTTSIVTIGDGNAFAGESFYVNNGSATNYSLIPATGTTFDEVGLDKNYRIEDKMFHKVDDGSKGLISWVANNVYVTDGGTDHSIQRGIDVATAGDTVNVEAGTYSLTSSVNVNKQLTLLGAQAGVDARTRSGAESIVDASAVAGYPQAAITVPSGVDGAIINGFTVQGATGLTGVYLAAGSNSTQVVNNIIRNNTTGMYLSNTGAGNALLIEHNLFIDNTAAGPASGHGIYVDQYTTGGTLINVDINENTFTNTSPVVDSWGVGVSNTGSTAFTDLSITDNSFDNLGRGMYFYNTASSSITGNTVSNAPRYAIGIFGNNGTPANASLTISNNVISGSGKGLYLESDTSAAAYAGPLTVTGNEFNTTGVQLSVYNDSASAIDATANEFNGVLASSATTTQQFAIVDTIVDAVDLPASGLVRTKSGEVFLTVNSFYVGPPYTQAGTSAASLQRAINAATAGNTIRVNSGTYTGDSSIDKNLTLLSETGAASTTLTGVNTGYGGALSVADGVDNVTIGNTGKGFTINGTGESALYLISNNDNTTVRANVINSAADKTALLTGGQQTNSSISGNTFAGTGASPLVYVNGEASLSIANASSNVDFTGNSFTGTKTGPLLGQEASGSEITSNTFTGSSSYAGLELWGANNTVSGNSITGGGAGAGILVNAGVTGTVIDDSVADNTISGYGVGILVAGAATIEGNGATITGNTTGIEVTGTASIIDNSVTANGTGIDVNGGTALVQGNDLNSNTIGVRINSGQADLGQLGLGTDFTGLGVSSGDNDFTLYTTTATASAGAVVNLKTTPPQDTVGRKGLGLANGDVPAFNNDWNVNTPIGIENVVYHDSDDAGVGFVDFAAFGNLVTNVSDGTIDEGDSVTVDGSFTNVPQAHIVTINWGDGSPLETLPVLVSGDFDFVSPPHTYADDQNGPVDTTTYTITITVKEAALPNTALPSQQHNVDVSNVVPSVIVNGSAPTINEGGAYSVTFGAVTDPGDDTATGYAIDFGDGNFVTVDANSTPITGPGTYVSPLNYDGPQNYTVQVLVQDDDGSFVAGQTPLNVINLDPTTNGFTRTFASVVEGTTNIVTWLTPGDPSTDDAADLRFDYDINGDGDYNDVGIDIVGSSLSSATVPGSQNTPGTHTVNSQMYDTDAPYTNPSDPNDGYVLSSTSYTVTPATFRVSSVTANSSGFDIVFNHKYARKYLNIYGADPSDVIVQQFGNTIPGSLVYTNDTTLSFVATGGTLSGSYSLLLKSGSATAFTDNLDNDELTGGGQLDGNSNGTAGDDYFNSSINVSSAGRVISIFDFARGPGQEIDLPADSPAQDGMIGMPLRLSDAKDVRGVQFTLNFDIATFHIKPADLELSTAASAAGWQVVPIPGVNLDVDGNILPGTIIIVNNPSTPTSLSTVTGPKDVLILHARVPDTMANYGQNRAIRFNNVILSIYNNVTTVPTAARGDVALHSVTYIGDTDRDAEYTPADIANIASLAVLPGFFSFQKHPGTDPVIIADIENDLDVTVNDVNLMTNEVLLYQFTDASPEIPAIPPANLGNAPLARGATTVSMPSKASTQVDGSVVLPLKILMDATQGPALMFDLVYDPAVQSFSEATGAALSQTARDAGLQYAVRLVKPGLVRVVVFSGGSVAKMSQADLMTVTFGQVKSTRPVKLLSTTISLNGGDYRRKTALQTQKTTIGLTKTIFDAGNIVKGGTVGAVTTISSSDEAAGDGLFSDKPIRVIG